MSGASEFAQPGIVVCERSILMIVAFNRDQGHGRVSEQVTPRGLRRIGFPIRLGRDSLKFVIKHAVVLGRNPTSLEGQGC